MSHYSLVWTSLGAVCRGLSVTMSTGHSVAVFHLKLVQLTSGRRQLKLPALLGWVYLLELETQTILENCSRLTTKE